MLLGKTRKLSIIPLLFSLTGWILFGVGFGIRNFRFKDTADVTAAIPEYYFFWSFLCIAPVVLILSFVMSLLDSNIPAFVAYIFLPAFLVCAGGVLFLDGLAIFNYHREEIRNYFDGESNINLGCSDTRIGIPLNVAIHNQGNYIPVEFAGVVITVAAYWLYLLLVPCFASKQSYSYE